LTGNDDVRADDEQIPERKGEEGRQKVKNGRGKRRGGRRKVRVKGKDLGCEECTRKECGQGL